MTEIYVSTDIEANGPIPGPFSMLSFASAAFLVDKTLVDTFTANLETLPGASVDPHNQAFWDNHPEAWAACREDPQPPGLVFPKYADWLDALPGIPVFVGYPATYDFMFIYWYLIRYAGRSPFRHHGLDLRTYAMAMLKKGFKKAGKGDMPRRWFDPHPHTHRALDDAIEQGLLFCNMFQENLAKK